MTAEVGPRWGKEASRGARASSEGASRPRKAAGGRGGRPAAMSRWFFPWSSSIKKRACRYLLQHYLGHFLEERLGLEQLSLDLYAGAGRLSRLHLDVWEQGNVGTSTIAVRPSPDPVAGPSTGVFSPLGQDHSSQSHETLGNAVLAPSTSPNSLTVDKEEGKVRRNIIHVKPYNGQGPWRNTGVFSHLFPDPSSQRRGTLGSVVSSHSPSPDSVTLDEWFDQRAKKNKDSNV